MLTAEKHDVGEELEMNTKNYIDGFLSRYRNYKTYWNYEDGCVLTGCKQLFTATSEKKYLDFVLDYLEPFIDEDGTVNNFEIGKNNIDGFNAGKCLFFAYDQTKNEKYKRAIEFLIKQLGVQPRIPDGNFWHKGIYPDQVWLDGLYMAQPFYMEYETRFNNKEHYNDILNQFRNVRRFLFDSDKGLYYHGYDDAKIQPWADKKTGRSSNFWLRSMGWLLMALVDTADAMSPEIYEQYREYGDMLREALRGILRFRDDKTGLFLQVIDRPDLEGNYAETSGSAMIAYTVMKACRLGIISSEKYAHIGADIFASLEKHKLKEQNGSVSLCDICLVAGLGPGDKRDGSAEYYVSEKTGSDDSKGVGPFMMAYAERLMLDRQ